MKTAISVPDPTYSAVEARAAVLGMSRSEFYTRGAQLLLERTEAGGVTARIDVVVEYLGDGDSSHEDAVSAGRRVLAGDGENAW